MANAPIWKDIQKLKITTVIAIMVIIVSSINFNYNYMSNALCRLAESLSTVGGRSQFCFTGKRIKVQS